MTRGDIWWADFGIPFGSEPGFRRPVLIVQNNDFNRSKINTVIIVPLTTNLKLKEAPGNVFLDKDETKLKKDSVAVVSQIYAIDRTRLLERINKIDSTLMNEVETGLLLVLGINNRGSFKTQGVLKELP